MFQVSGGWGQRGKDLTSTLVGGWGRRGKDLTSTLVGEGHCFRLIFP